jgi:hypothetical protein
MTETGKPAQLRLFFLMVCVLLSGLTLILSMRGFEHAVYVSAGCTLILLLTTLGAPQVLMRPFEVWMSFAHKLGVFNSSVLMSIIFIVLITPVGLLRRWFGQSPITTGFDANAESYRTASKSSKPEDYKRPY